MQLPPRLDGLMKTLGSLTFVGFTFACRFQAQSSSHSTLPIIDCKTTPSFARSPKSGVFEQVLKHGREMGEGGEEGVTRPGEKGNGERRRRRSSEEVLKKL